MARNPDALRKTALSVIDRLKATAKATGTDTRSLITRFALERWLHRMVVSGQSHGFVLKGGMVMPLLGEGYRPTEDIDGHRDIEMTVAEVEEMVRTISKTEPTQEDGLEFDTEGMKVEPIRDGLIPGTRVTLRAWLRPASGNPTEIKIKLDLCYGDAITPDAVFATLPSSVKGLDPVSLEVFPWPTVVSEKLHAISRHGLLNSRVKDFFDLLMVSRSQELDGQVLVDAVTATFRRWGGSEPTAGLPGLTREFATLKGRDWAGFLKRGGIRANLPDFAEIVAEVGRFAQPILEAAEDGSTFTMTWQPGAGWGEVPAPRL